MKKLKFLAILLLILSLCSSLCFGESNLTFDGNDNIRNSNGISGIDVDARTQTAWFQCDSFTGIHTIMMDASAISAGNSAFRWACAAEAGSNIIDISYRWTTTSGNWDAGTVSGSTWIFGFTTYDRGTTTNDPTFLNNCVSQTITEDATPNGTAKTGVDSMTIGENVGGTEDLIGDLAFATHYAVAIPSVLCGDMMYKPGSVVDSMKMFWLLMDTGTQKDLSGNGADGTVTGTTASLAGPPIMFGGGLPL